MCDVQYVNNEPFLDGKKIKQLGELVKAKVKKHTNSIIMRVQIKEEGVTYLAGASITNLRNKLTQLRNKFDDLVIRDSCRT